MNTSEVVTMRDVRLLEFNKNRSIEEQKALVFDQENCRYDVILGADFLNKAGMVIDYLEKNFKWFGDVIPLRVPSELSSVDFVMMVERSNVETEEEDLGDDVNENYLSSILDAKYDAMDICEVMRQQTHLTASQRDDLRNLLLKYPELFDGKLGVYPNRQFHIDVDPEAVPVNKRHYPVPNSQRETYKKELDHLVSLGVLSYQGASEWGMPSFIVPKKDGRVY